MQPYFSFPLLPNITCRTYVSFLFVVFFVVFHPEQHILASESGSPADSALSPFRNQELFQQAIEISQFKTSNQHSLSDKSRTIREIITDIKEIEEDYLEELEANRSSYGVYAVGKYDYDVKNNESRHEIGLEWRLFNDGYFEAVREDSKKVLQAQLEFYQMRRDMIERLLEDDLYELSTIENSVQARHYHDKQKVLEEVLETRTRQAHHGFTTRLDVLSIHRQLAETNQNLNYFESSKHGELSNDLIALLNDLEAIELKSKQELATLASDNSYNLKIQDNFTERSTFFPAWSDEVAVNLTADHRREFYGTERQVIGLEVEMPLTLDLERDSLVKAQKRIYRYQKEAVQRRLQQQLEQLCSFFNYQQNRLKTQQKRIVLELKQIKENTIKEQYVIQALDQDPSRILDQLTITLIDSRYDALATRLKIYQIILKVMALTQAQAITDLFQFL